MSAQRQAELAKICNTVRGVIKELKRLYKEEERYLYLMAATQYGSEFHIAAMSSCGAMMDAIDELKEAIELMEKVQG